MTNQEAAEILYRITYFDHKKGVPNRDHVMQALRMGISALEKQIPKKPGYTKLIYKCNGEDIEINNPECSYCRTHGFSLWDAAIPVGDKYCKRCGQAIDWGNE